jgi:hypothetical protein
MNQPLGACTLMITRNSMNSSAATTRVNSPTAIIRPPIVSRKMISAPNRMAGSNPLGVATRAPTAAGPIPTFGQLCGISSRPVVTRISTHERSAASG